MCAPHPKRAPRASHHQPLASLFLCQYLPPHHSVCSAAWLRLDAPSSRKSSGMQSCPSPSWLQLLFQAANSAVSCSQLQSKSQERNYPLKSGTHGTDNHTRELLPSCVTSDKSHGLSGFRFPSVQGPSHLQMASFPSLQPSLLLATPCTLSSYETVSPASKVTLV